MVPDMFLIINCSFAEGRKLNEAMQQTVNSVASRRIIVDEAFNAGRPEAHELFLFIDDEEFSYAVAEKQEKKFRALESWNINSPEQFPEQLLTELYESSAILHAGKYRRVICCSGFRNATLIPAPLYDPYAAEEQLRFASAVGKSDEIITDSLRQLEASNVFSMPANVHHEIATWFQNAEFHHTSTSIIEYLLAVNRNSGEEMITVNFHFNYLEIIVTHSKKLLFYNTFNFTSPEESLYYILFVIEQLHLNPGNSDVRFAGEINETDEIFVLAKKYIRNLGWIHRPENYSYSYSLEALPSQFHFNLFSQLVCVS